VKEYAKTLRRLAKDFRLAGEGKLCDAVLLALADITEASDVRADLSYSFIMRKLRKLDKDRAKEFQVAYKQAFDEAFLSGLDNLDEVALLQAVQEIDLDSEELE